MRRGCLALLVALSVLGGCVPPETDPLRRFPADTALGELQETGTMRIAVDTNWRPFGDEDANGPRGFAVDLGGFVAGEMGMESQFIAASSPDEVAGLVNDGEADLGFAAFELTEESVRNNSLTDPFFVAHQRLAIPAGSAIEAVDDLEGKRVCEVVHEITGVSVSELIEPVDVSEENDVGSCAMEARRGTVDAVSAPDGLLLQWLETDGANPNLELTATKPRPSGGLRSPHRSWPGSWVTSTTRWRRPRAMAIGRAGTRAGSNR